MSPRSLNKVTLIGNLTRDPELRYTPQGTAVCTFGVATNRSWTTDTGEKREETEFHRIVAWNKLAELCSQLLTKGRKVYVEGRLSTRTWTGQDSVSHTTTEIIIEDMIVLDSKRPIEGAVSESFPAPVSVTPAVSVSQPVPAAVSSADDNKASKAKKKNEEKTEETEKSASVETSTFVETSADKTDIDPTDIPF
ncbi:MAG: single-stranded DNA-binding protein [Patescibacteria group bacterium]|nr:single-stranded DNA-binding protein [Patescibacteria group bacterium]